MIEFSTGVMFLMSSLYGSGHANAQVAAVNSAVMQASGSESKATTTMAVRPLKEPAEIEAYLRKEFADDPILVEIAWCESRFKQFNPDGTVVRGRVNSKDVGLMQINERFHAEDAVEKGYDIYTVEGNIAFGKYLHDKFGTDPWKLSRKCWGQSGDIAKK